MAIDIKRFDPNTAVGGHDDTILASPVLPDSMEAPFAHQYGYLKKGGAMAGHAHQTDEIYIVLSGSGYVILAGKNKAVCAGDVVAIPAGQWHTMLCTDRDAEPFLWAALWWEPVEGAETREADGCIHVKRFVKEKAQKAHEGTILADSVVPEVIPVPFGHAYGYIEGGGEMETHAHPTAEVYIVYSGSGLMTVGDESCEVGPGDVIAIPRNASHTLSAPEGTELLWAAFWWD